MLDTQKAEKALHKDSNLGVPKSPLCFYLRGEQKGYGLASVTMRISAILCSFSP